MGLVLKTCADCGKLVKIGGSKSRCKSCRKADPAKFQNRPFGSGPKKAGMERWDSQPFNGWRVRNLPKCVISENGYSEIGLSRRQFRFVLQAYGYATYADYLRSSMWQAVRAKVLAAAKCQCGCGHAANQVHHQTYTEANLLGLSIKGMVAIRAECHYAIEFAEGCKVELPQANAQLRSRQNGNVVGMEPPTAQELRDYLSGQHMGLSSDRKLVIRQFLRQRKSQG